MEIVMLHHRNRKIPENHSFFERKTIHNVSAKVYPIFSSFKNQLITLRPPGPNPEIFCKK